MPDFNFINPAVLDHHFSSLRFWLNRGLDGYRLNAVPHLIKTAPRTGTISRRAAPSRARCRS